MTRRGRDGRLQSRRDAGAVPPGSPRPAPISGLPEAPAHPPLRRPACRASQSGESESLLVAARRGDPQAREALVAAHLDLVRAVATGYRGRGLALEDLVQEGAIGLLEAIDRYDDARSDFRRLARRRVRFAIRRAVARQPPRPRQHAAGRPAGDPERAALEHERAALLHAAVERLPQRQRELVLQRWGLGRPARSAAALARDLHLSRSRTQAIESDALYELRNALEATDASP